MLLGLTSEEDVEQVQPWSVHVLSQPRAKCLYWCIQHRGQLQIHPKDSGAEGRTKEELSNLTLEIPSQDEFRKCLEIMDLRASPAFISKSRITGYPTQLR